MSADKLDRVIGENSFTVPSRTLVAVSSPRRDGSLEIKPVGNEETISHKQKLVRRQYRNGFAFWYSVKGTERIKRNSPLSIDLIDPRSVAALKIGLAIGLA